MEDRIISSRKNNNEYLKYKVSKDDLLRIINDIFLTNYWCTRKNMVNINQYYIVGINEIKEWHKIFSHVNFEDINHLGYQKYKIDELTNFDIAKYLKKKAKPVYDILNIGEGKISLCGGAISSILEGKLPRDYDLFFHGDSVDEIDDIFNKCLIYLDGLTKLEGCLINYDRSKYVMNVKAKISDVIHFYGEIQFIKRAYRTKEQVLFGFDLAPCRVGYNQKDGLFATICGAMALSMNAFSLDSSVRSTSFGERLNKYCYYKDYNIFLPQLNESIIEQDKFEIFDNILLATANDGNRFTVENYNSEGNDYVAIDNIINCLMKENYDDITFWSDDLKLISELPDNFIEKQVRKQTNYIHDRKSGRVMNFTREYSKEFFGNNYKRFALAYFVDEDEQKADEIWEEQVNHYINMTKDYVKNLNEDKNYYKGWKYLNPGHKHFGQNKPVNTPPTKYYNPLVVGIDNNRFQALMDCRKNIQHIFDLPNEVFQLICDYWLKYEADDARNRLVNLDYDFIVKFNEPELPQNIDGDLIFS